MVFQPCLDEISEGACVGALVEMRLGVHARRVAAEAGFDLVDEDDVCNVEQRRRVGFHGAVGDPLRAEGAVVQGRRVGAGPAVPDEGDRTGLSAPRWQSVGDVEHVTDDRIVGPMDRHQASGCGVVAFSIFKLKRVTGDRGGDVLRVGHGATCQRSKRDRYRVSPAHPSLPSVQRSVVKFARASNELGRHMRSASLLALM